MLLDINKHKIKYFVLSVDRNHTKLSDFIHEFDLNNPKLKGYLAWNSKKEFDKLTGIYYGNINDVINAKLDDNIQPTDKLYFDSMCTFPRFKLESRGMKRTIKINSADRVIVSQIKADFNIISYNVRPTDSYLAYSPKSDTYYLFNWKPHDPYYQSAQKTFYNICCNLAPESEHHLFDVLKAAKMLPNDAYILPDTVDLLDNKNYDFYDKCINKYMRITYDTDLDKFISEGLMKLQEEDLATLNTMLASRDEAVRGMGMKLLSSYDVGSAPCAIAIMLKKNWINLRYSETKKSVGFQQVLRSLNLSDKEIDNNGLLTIINNVYDACTTQKAKDDAREAVRLMVQNDGIEFLDQKCKDLENYNLSYDLKIY